MTFSDLNSFGKRREPFLFICDYKAQNLIVIRLDELEKEDVEFSIQESTEQTQTLSKLEKFPQEFKEYKKKFDYVIEKIKSGETYLLNLTAQTPIKTKLTLKEIFTNANANYKLRYKDEFVCFSPEKFIGIKDNIIDTYPMKGTIDASIKNAKQMILEDKKEMAEHIMVVDLLRNDLSIVASDVLVKKFRYIQTIGAGDKKLLQVSSHISGNIGYNWHENIGNILKSLLPAGSISGTPKISTLNIIDTIEDYDREYFSGIFGVYNGKSLDSGVMIRFIQNNKDGYMYKSGGGITLDSDAKSEYNELLDKIYLP